MSKDTFEIIKKTAKQGDAMAQHKLGLMYKIGLEVPKDMAKAVSWYRLAAVQGHAAAQSSLGTMYLKGDGVTEDDSEAVHWFRLAAEQGDKLAQFSLGTMSDELGKRGAQG